MKTFDFTEFQEPRFEVKLGKRDTDGNFAEVMVLHVDVVDVALMKRLMSMAKDLKTIDGSDDAAIDGVYGIVAEILSANDENCVLTGSELRHVYRMSLAAAVNFIGAYMDFVGEVANAKN